MKRINTLNRTSQVSIEKLNEIILAINKLIDVYEKFEVLATRVREAQVELERQQNDFISAYGSIIDNTPQVMEMLEAYTNIASSQIEFIEAGEIDEA